MGHEHAGGGLPEVVFGRVQYLQATNPMREETVRGADGRDYLVLYYYTDVRQLDDRALCLAWRHSYPMLMAARSPEERLAVVQRRQEYLDELHRRSPEGLAAWFAAGGRASSNPLPFLAAREEPQDPRQQRAS